MSEDELNRWGNNGWELVTHTSETGYGRHIQYYVFKREKIDKN
jgi:hypothetical protein